MGKHRFAPSTRRFANVVHAPCVYIAELSNGAIKIGASSSARARLISLATEVKREHGAELRRFHVVQAATTKAAYELETLLVKCMERVAAPMHGRREYFANVTFERACDLFGLAVPVGDEQASSDFSRSASHALQLASASPATPRNSLASHRVDALSRMEEL